MNRPTLVLIVRRDLTVPEFGVAVAHACEALLLTPDLGLDVADVVIKGARNEGVLLDVNERLGDVERYAFREETVSPHTGEPFRLAGQLVSVGIQVGERDAVLGLAALDGLHALEDLDGPKLERVQCEGRWPDYKQKEPDGTVWRCKNEARPGEKFCAKKACADRRSVPIDP